MSDTTQNHEIPTDNTPAVQTKAKQKTGHSGFFVACLALLLAVGAIGGIAWLYQQAQRTQLEINQLKANATNGSAISNDIKQVRNQIGLMQVDARTLGARLAQAEASTHQSTLQYDTLNSMYHDLTKNRADWILSEVAHSLQITSQHLQLTGDVDGTITALTGINKRLSTFNRPQLINIKRAIANDLAKLNSLPKVNVVESSIQLEQLQISASSLPLIVDANQNNNTVKAKPNNSSAAKQTFWQKLGSDISDNFSKLVSIRRIDKPETFLLSPEQAFFLHENLKLHLMDARLALLGRNSAIYQQDLSSAEHYVRSYFDTNATATKSWLNSLTKLKNLPISNTAPSLEKSLQAVQDAQKIMEQTP